MGSKPTGIVGVGVDPVKRKRLWPLPFVVAILMAVGVTPGSADDKSTVGNPVSREVAQRVAVNHLNSVSAPAVLSRMGPISEETVTGVVTATRQGRDLYYIFDLGERGWVVVAADNVASPIIAYSDKGPIRLGDPPPAFSAWMENVEDEIFDAITNKLVPLQSATEAWTTLNIPTVDFQSKLPERPELHVSVAAVSTLLSTTWSQGGKEWYIGTWRETYDYYCPREYKVVLGVGYYRVAPTGCVATAMGQIMKYHAWPPVGDGSHTWDPPFAAEFGSGSGHTYTTYNAHTVDFSSRNFDWASMPNEVISELWDIDENEKKVGQVLRDIGVAVEMNYEPDGSGAFIGTGTCNQTSTTDHCSLKAFHDYFRYHARFARKSYVTTSGTTITCRNDTEWKNLLKPELDAARPVLYRGQNGGGHAFVCDGYDSSDRFHFNWGWGGSHDGYFAIGDLTPGTHDYSAHNAVVYGIRPDTPPIASCKATALYLDGNGQAVLTTSDVDNGSYDPDGSSVTLQLSNSQFSCSNVGTPQSVTLTVTDSTGNTDSCVARLTVVDNTAPVVVTGSITVPLDANGQVSIAADDVDNGSFDNCGIIGKMVAPNSFTCANVGPNSVALTVHDVNGNSASQTATVTVVDSMNPTISCPVDVVVDTDPGSSTAVVGSLAPTRGDNCGVVRQTWTMTGATTGASPSSGIHDVSGEAFNVGVTLVSYTVEDTAGNDASCQFTVTVSDNEAPTITCPTSVTVNTDPGQASAVVNGLSPTTNDNIGVVQQTWTMTGATTGASPTSGIHDASGQTFNVGVTQVSYTVEDAAGNQATCQFTVTVTDNEVPTITCPVDVTVDTDPGNSTAVVNGLAPTTGDNVGVVEQTWTMTGATTAASPSSGIHDVSGETFNIGVTQVIYTVEDAAGNEATCQFTVTVADNEVPTITCPADVAADTDPGNPTAVVNGLAPTTGDNVGVVEQTWTMTGATTGASPSSGIHDVSGETFNIGVTQVIYTVEDAAGNEASCQFTVTVTDNEVPTISCPVDVTADTDPGNPTAVVNGLAPTTGDNVGVVAQTWTMIGATSGTSPSSGIHDVSGEAFNVGVTQVTYTVADAAGNEASCQFTVTVTDNEVPTITCPANVDAETDPGNPTAVLNGLAPTTNDNLGVVLQTWVMSGATIGNSPSTGINDVSGQTFNVGATTVTYYVEDQQGNSASCDFTVTVIDNEDPILTCPDDVEVVEYTLVSAVVYGLSPTTDDNCGVELLTWSMSGATTNSSPAVGIHDVSGETFNVGVTTVTYHCEDEAGNGVDCAFDVHLIPQRNIPTLNEWGLILMVSLLAMGGFALIRRWATSA
ncbi:MAG: IPTL-CTERM sorting domain-containing protein [bacterium]|nr:IPTL-CTERM sorting domain-containing protein [bacterium]